MPPREPGASKARTSDRIYVQGHYYWPEIGDAGPGTDIFTVVPNAIYAVPFIAGRAVSFVSAVWQGGTATPPGKVRFGLYGHDEGAGRPSNLIGQTRDFLPVGAMPLEWGFPAPLTLADAVWFVSIYDSAVIMRGFGRSTSFRNAPLGSTIQSPAVASDLLSGLLVTYPFGELPAVFPAGAISYLPAEILPRFGLRC